MRCVVGLLMAAVLLSSCSFAGLSNSKSKNFDQAVKDLIDKGKYQQAADLMSNEANYNQNSIKTLINVAWMYAFDKQFEKSLKITEEILGNNPDYPEVYYLRGFIYQKQENYTQALENFKKAISIDPKDIKSYSSLAEIYQILEKYDESINYYQQASSLEPENYTFHLDLANVYFKKFEFELAINEAQKALNYAPQSDKEEVKETLENIKLNAVLNNKK